MAAKITVSKISSAPVESISKALPVIPAEPVLPPRSNLTVKRENESPTTEEVKLERGSEQVAIGGNAKYEGDALDFSAPLDNGKWETVDFESPFELIYTFDRFLNSGRVELHKWQMEILEELAKVKPTDDKAYRLALCAANGSGKDKYIVAPFVIWFALTKIRSLTVITSSSGPQLTAQTENYISSLARDINTHFGRPIFKINQRFIKCLKSGSEIRLFATDEAGRAEGYHPLEPGAEMCIIVNEAKTVNSEIFGALERCTGYNYWLNVSTPGEPAGDFYDSFNNWPHSRRVTAFDCPHLKKDTIDEVARKRGINSFHYRSQVLAEFTQIAGTYVISQDFLNACILASNTHRTKIIDFGKPRIGVDLAAGRDECAFVVSKGNRVIEEDFFVEGDTTVTEDRLERLIIKHGGELGKNCDVFADDGGLGHGIIDRLVRKGYNITRVLNQSRALNNTQFGNRGAEMWFGLGRLIEEKLIYLPLNPTGNKDHNKLYEQLTLRRYKETDALGRITLQSKKEAKEMPKDGKQSTQLKQSPDRADAYVLSFCGTDFDEISKAIKDAAPVAKPLGMTIEQLMAARNARHRELVCGNSNTNKTPIENNSFETLFAMKANSNN